MKTARNRTKTATIALFLLLTIATSIVALPLVNVAKAANYNNPADIAVEPNPVGVGQTVLITFFLVNPPPTATAGFNPDTNWANFTLKITSPTGNVENFGPYASDATGGNYLSYTPHEVGQYQIVFTYPGQTIAGNYYTPQSATVNMTVQQEPIQGYSTPPLPTSYWRFPIYGENRGWYAISGNWYANFYNNTVKFNPYTTAPNTAHIVWTRQQYMGGIAGGGDNVDAAGADLTYYEGPIYQNYFIPPLIISGKLYYMERYSSGDAFTGMHCVDIATGKELWFDDASVLGGHWNGLTGSVYGQVFSPNGANGAGSFPYIWDTFGPDWKVFDANTGRLIYTITNVSQPPGFLAYAQILAGGFDPMNSILAYYVDGTNDWLLMWNSTRMLSAYAGYLSENLYSAPVGQTIDWTQGIQWNVTIPHHEGQSFGIPGSPGSNNGITPSDGNVIFTTTASLLAAVDNFTVTAYSCKTGSQLWSRDFSDMFTPGSTTFEFWGTVYDGVMALYNRETREWYGYDESTGNRLWGPTAPLPAAWDTFTSSTAGYDKLFVGTYAGNIYCYDIKNGTLEWTYNLPSSGYNTPYGGYPLLGGITVADGKIYAATGEHTPNNPYYLGAAMYCVNATTGKLIYQMSGWWSSSPFIADGYAVNQNCYDGTIYSFGKGQTAVTVSAPDTVATLGQSIVIKGTVMDESPGAMDYAGNRLSKDTPAIADAYMTEWMEYLYQQKPMPTNATGVTVSLDVVDSNGNFRNIGTTTSDATGAFSYVWQPDITGKYTLYASFAGSESYYGSSTETAFAVSEAPTAPPTATPVAQAPVETYFTVSTIAIIVAIVIVGVLMLRKRP